MEAIGLIALLLQAGPARAPHFLEEPSYFIHKSHDWELRKPKLQVVDEKHASYGAWTIFRHHHLATVEQRLHELPRLRLSRALMKYDPVTRQRKLVEDWTGEEDAREAERDIRLLIYRFAPAAARDLFRATPFYMALLNGAAGHTAEEPDDSGKFVVYLDPFEATGRLHAASTLVHELSHVERYRKRGFHANRSAAILSKADFTLLGAADELAGYEAEAALIQAFLRGKSEQAAEQALREWMPAARLKWPVPLRILLGYEGPAGEAGRTAKARRQIVLELQRQASRYWDFHHEDTLEPALAETIRHWYSTSSEWKAIGAQRKDWVESVASASRQQE